LFVHAGRPGAHRTDPASPSSGEHDLLLDKDDAARLGIDPRVDASTYSDHAVWSIHTDLEETEDVDHCFEGDVLFEGSGEVAIEAGTCVSDQHPIETELPE
jgi:hypothetical protein